MSKDLSTSAVARQNVLNNPYALTQLETHLALGGLLFEDETLFSKQQAAEILAVDERTIERTLASSEEELKANGYRVLLGKALKNIRLAYVVDMLDPAARRFSCNKVDCAKLVLNAEHTKAAA